MNEGLKKDIPPAVSEMIAAIVNQAVARCDRLGIALEDFYQAMLEEQKLHPEISVADLFERTFLRLESRAN